MNFNFNKDQVQHVSMNIMIIVVLSSSSSSSRSFLFLFFALTTADNICRERRHILSPATIYARRQNMPQHGLFPLTGVVDGKHSDCVSHLLQVFSVDVTFCDFGSLVLHALFLAFYVFHGCRLLEVERGGNSGFGPPAHQH